MVSARPKRFDAFAGAASFLGSELTKQLLEASYTVRATARSVLKETVGHLQALGDAFPGKLELHEADLMTPGSYDLVARDAVYM